MNDIERRIWEGRTTVVLGTRSVPLASKSGATIVRIACDLPRESFGPLLALDKRVAFLLGDATEPLLEQARAQVFELGRRVLGDVSPSKGTVGHVVAAANRLSKGPAAIVFDAVEAADEATLEALALIVSKPGWLKVPLLLGIGPLEPEGAAVRRLVEAVEKAGGPAAVLRSTPPVRDKAQLSATALPETTRFVVRAASVVGAAFELPLLAELVDQDPLEVLVHLQHAKDAGLELDDRGDGTFVLDPSQAAALRDGLLPSLRALLHRRAAELLTPRADVSPPPAPPPPAPPPPVSPPAPQPPAERDDDEPAPDDPVRAPFEPKPREAVREMKSPLSSEPGESARTLRPERSDGFGPAPSKPEEHLRASEHHLEGGDLWRAIEQGLLAAAKSASLGAHGRAEALALRAIEATRGLPPSNRSRLLEARALAMLGRVRLEGYAPTDTFDLSSAVEPLEAAQKRLLPSDPPELTIEVAELLAATHCDKGDAASLDRALAVLVEASRALLAAGNGAQATRLLNDQAAVYLRMADPVRAMALLEQAREVFERRAASDPVARRELAETDHLIARIPLHVAARPGRRDDAYARALDHAISAKRSFAELGEAISAARVEETMGRLELGRGRLEEAIEHLKLALAEQDRLSDLVGLARTSAALSSTLLAADRASDALALLADSVELNHQKGSAIGVAYNRRAFDAIAHELRGAPGSAALLGEVRGRLERAEHDLGAIHLPGERDP